MEVARKMFLFPYAFRLGEVKTSTYLCIYRCYEKTNFRFSEAYGNHFKRRGKTFQNVRLAIYIEEPRGWSCDTISIQRLKRLFPSSIRWLFYCTLTDTAFSQWKGHPWRLRRLNFLHTAIEDTGKKVGIQLPAFLNTSLGRISIEA